MKVYQIYFDESQFPGLEPEYIPILNSHCTVYFESQVIHDLVMENKHRGEDYFGVVSYKLRSKLGYMKNNWKGVKNIANMSINNFTPKDFSDELYKHRPDAMSFQRHVGHDPVAVGNMYHANFQKYWDHIMRSIGYNWKNERYENVFYCNYFVAKSEIYEKYVKEMLSPAMKVMDQMPELMGNSGYPSILPDNLKKSFGIDWYPYHAFIAERFFSYFAHLHNLKCLHY